MAAGLTGLSRHHLSSATHSSSSWGCVPRINGLHSSSSKFWVYLDVSCQLDMLRTPDAQIRCILITWLLLAQSISGSTMSELLTLSLRLSLVTIMEETHLPLLYNSLVWFPLRPPFINYLQLFDGLHAVCTLIQVPHRMNWITFCGCQLIVNFHLVSGHFILLSAKNLSNCGPTMSHCISCLLVNVSMLNC